MGERPEPDPSDDAERLKLGQPLFPEACITCAHGLLRRWQAGRSGNARNTPARLDQQIGCDFGTPSRILAMAAQQEVVYGAKR